MPETRVFRIHPLRPQASAEVANQEVLAALLQVRGNEGNLRVMAPGFASVLQPLFEEPIRNEEGQLLPPWSPQAVDYLLEIGLARAGFAALAEDR